MKQYDHTLLLVTVTASEWLVGICFWCHQVALRLAVVLIGKSRPDYTYHLHILTVNTSLVPSPKTIVRNMFSHSDLFYDLFDNLFS